MQGMIIKPTLFSFYILFRSLRHLPLTTVKLMEVAISFYLVRGGYCDSELFSSTTFLIILVGLDFGGNKRITDIKCILSWSSLTFKLFVSFRKLVDEFKN